MNKAFLYTSQTYRLHDESAMFKPFSSCFKTLLLGFICLAYPLCCLALASTPLETNHFTRSSRSSEMSDFMQRMATSDARVRLEIIGHSVQGRPIEALIFSKPQQSNSPRLKLLLIGSQHGASEPASGEAMLAIANDILTGPLSGKLDALDIMIIPNANPDGRDLGTRANAQGININADFVRMSQPETRALKFALLSFQPDVTLDSHESAVLKRKSLGREGYMTDFNAQFESSNHPSTPLALRQLAYNTLLPEITQRVTADKLPAHRYIGEIVSIKQPITNGGLTLKNFRNLAGMHGTLSFLVETKLDNGNDSYPTHRNIKVRLERQLICLRNFIDVIDENRELILHQVAGARAAQTHEALTLKAHYASDPSHPFEDIPLRRLDTRALEIHRFADHRRIETASVLPLPRALAITQHQSEMARFLEAQSIAFVALKNKQKTTATLNHFVWDNNPLSGAVLQNSSTREVELAPGTLLVDLSQPRGRLAMLLLDPRSNSTIFIDPDYKTLLEAKQTFFIYPLL
ncbi:MAG TPA: M14 family zinc carboxypeptidase [Pseudomonadales bacterium]|nr:M14 family zinc carboxypeptidase [Pseudomonadales bacterium]